jgi:hypothetical protein
MRVVFVLTPLLLVVPAAAQSVVMSPEAFVAELQRVRAELSSGAPGQVPAPRLPTVWVIDTGNQRFETPTGWLRNQVENARRDPARWAAQRRTILEQLEALKTEAQELAQPSESDAGIAHSRAVLADVLADPEFRRFHQQSLMAHLWERISQLLLRTWDRLGGSAVGSRSTAIVFAWVTVLVAFGVLGLWIGRLVLRPRRNRRPTMRLPAARVRSARAWAHDAVTALDPREATRCGYRAMVRGLEEEGVWRSDPARTPREYLRLLPYDHRRQAPLTDVARRFEEVWFGARAATEEDRRAVLSRLQELGCLPAD